MNYLNDIENYYDKLFKKYGTKPRGVDWNSEEVQLMRFEQLSKVIQLNSSFSINDFGCGYGALYFYLRQKFKSFNYFGNDICDEMLSAARLSVKGYENAKFSLSPKLLQPADYTLASGIFNVKLKANSTVWLNYMVDTLRQIHEFSRFGFSFNCLTTYSDADKMEDHLFYADPSYFFDYCKKEFSRNVALLHDYNFYEFTIIVRKQNG